jgi:hypothetical protein
MANLKLIAFEVLDLTVDESSAVIRTAERVDLSDWARMSIQAVDTGNGTWASGVVTIEKSNDGENWSTTGTTISAAGFTSDIDCRTFRWARARVTTAESGGSRVRLIYCGWRETP